MRRPLTRGAQRRERGHGGRLHRRCCAVAGAVSTRCRLSFMSMRRHDPTLEIFWPRKSWADHRAREYGSNRPGGRIERGFDYGYASTSSPFWRRWLSMVGRHMLPAKRPSWCRDYAVELRPCPVEEDQRYRTPCARSLGGYVKIVGMYAPTRPGTSWGGAER